MRRPLRPDRRMPARHLRLVEGGIGMQLGLLFLGHLRLISAWCHTLGKRPGLYSGSQPIHRVWTEPVRPRHKMTDSSQVQIRRLMPADARLFREIRLEALQRAPEAFGSTFEQECSQSLAQFEEVLTKADVFGAFRETDLLGMAGYRTQVGAKRAHKGFLWGMYVRSSARGTGVAKPLVEAVLAHARERVELVQLTVVKEN